MKVILQDFEYALPNFLNGKSIGNKLLKLEQNSSLLKRVLEKYLQKNGIDVSFSKKFRGYL
jgi:hypothetical protein